MPCPESAVEPYPARCVRRGHPPPPASRPKYLAPHRMPFFRVSAGRVIVQTATELRYLQRRGHGPHVLRALPPPAPNLHSSLALHAACTAVARRLPPTNPHTSPHTACPPFDSRQGASSFNQPLSFDTSSVRTMVAMFQARSSPCPASDLQSSPPLHAACTAVVRRPAYLAPHRMPFDSWQQASAFNQPLNFDTSSVRGMYAMFYVRSSPCPAP